MGTLAEVGQVSPGVLVLQVTTVSKPYANRNGDPGLYRVYLDAQLTPPAPTKPPAAPTPPPTPEPAPAPSAGVGLPLEVPEAGEPR